MRALSVLWLGLYADKLEYLAYFEPLQLLKGAS